MEIPKLPPFDIDDDGLPYTVSFVMIPRQQPTEPSHSVTRAEIFENMPYSVFLSFQINSIDLKGFLQHGIAWTTRNLVAPTRGKILPWQGLAPVYGPEDGPMPPTVG